MFDTASIYLHDNTVAVENIPRGVKEFDIVRGFMSSSDILCKKIVIDSEQYRNGDVIILKVIDSDVIHVGVIISIIVKNSHAYFVSRLYEAKQLTNSYYFGPRELSTCYLRKDFFDF